MKPTTAILLAAAIIGACILAHLGYLIAHDRSVAEANRRQQEQEIAVAAENYKRVQSKEAWKTALKFIDVSFTRWLDKDLKLDRNHYVPIEFEYVKAFSLTDIQWHDPHKVTAHGVLLFTTKKMVDEGNDQQAFSWSRDVELKDDGVDRWWTTAGDPTFQTLSLTRDLREHMPVQYIVMPNLDGGEKINPLVR
jgi:hypothetical protein